MTIFVRPEAFLDTSVLIYATANNDHRSGAAIAALAAGGVTSVQVLSEFTVIAQGMLGLSWQEVHEALSIILTLCPKPLSIRLSTYEKALELVQQEQLALQNAMIAASALLAGCSRLLSGMVEDGRVLGEHLVVFNPFGPIEQAAPGSSPAACLPFGVSPISMPADGRGRRTPSGR